MVTPAALGVVLLLAGCGQSQPSEPAERAYSLQANEAALVASDQVLEARKGDAVTVTITSDRSLKLHLHGYDISAVSTPASPATISFTAAATGSFPITLHESSAGEHAAGEDHNGAEARVDDDAAGESERGGEAEEVTLVRVVLRP